MLCPTEAPGATGLELGLHPCTVLGGGVDGGAAARAGHLLARFQLASNILPIWTWDSKASILNQKEPLNCAFNEAFLSRGAT